MSPEVAFRSCDPTTRVLKAGRVDASSCSLLAVAIAQVVVIVVVVVSIVVAVVLTTVASLVSISAVPRP